MVDHFATLSTHPLVYLALPPRAFANTYGISGTIIHDQIIPLINQVAAAKRVPVIDVDTPTAPHSEWFPDGVHPNDTGYMLVAQVMHDGLLRPLDSRGRAAKVDRRATPVRRVKAASAGRGRRGDMAAGAPAVSGAGGGGGCSDRRSTGGAAGGSSTGGRSGTGGSGTGGTVATGGSTGTGGSTAPAGPPCWGPAGPRRAQARRAATAAARADLAAKRPAPSGAIGFAADRAVAFPTTAAQTLTRHWATTAQVVQPEGGFLRCLCGRPWATRAQSGVVALARPGAKNAGRGGFR